MKKTLVLIAMVAMFGLLTFTAMAGDVNILGDTSGGDANRNLSGSGTSTAGDGAPLVTAPIANSEANSDALAIAGAEACASSTAFNANFISLCQLLMSANINHNDSKAKADVDISYTAPRELPNIIAPYSVRGNLGLNDNLFTSLYFNSMIAETLEGDWSLDQVKDSKKGFVVEFWKSTVAASNSVTVEVVKDTKDIPITLYTLDTVPLGAIRGYLNDPKIAPEDLASSVLKRAMNGGANYVLVFLVNKPVGAGKTIGAGISVGGSGLAGPSAGTSGSAGLSGSWESVWTGNEPGIIALPYYIEKSDKGF